jgi:hypothetical protein
MNLIIKQILLIGTIFLTILWIQNIDDKKYKKERKSIYDKYKFPLLVSAIIGLILNLPAFMGFNCEIKKMEYNNEISRTFIHNNNFGNHAVNDKLSWFDNGIPEQIPQNNFINKSLDNIEQQIYTDLPDF